MIKSYKLFESEFVNQQDIDDLLDKISEYGIESITDVDKNRVNLFSEGDKEIIETIEKMGDITAQFKQLNNEIRRLQDSGESDGFHLMKDWTKLNSEMVPLEQSFRKWGIELGDPRLSKMMSKIMPDVYGNNIYNESLLDYFKKDNDYDKIALDIINRLEKVKDNNPYHIENLCKKGDSGFTSRPPSWTSKLSGPKETYSEIYLIRFDDVDVLIANDRHGLVHPNGISAGHKMNKYPWKMCVGNDDMAELIDCKKYIRKRLFNLTDTIFKSEAERNKINRIKAEFNTEADLLKESIEEEIVFTNKRNRNIKITISKSPDGRIKSIENETGIRFPFSIGQIMSRNIETWACNNNFLMSGKDTCPEKKIFGVKTSDVPKGHEWRHIYPNKFR